MASERKELVEMFKLSSADTEMEPSQLENKLNQMTDLELLRTVVGKVKEWNKNKKPHDDDQDDSLAFPGKVRQSKNLTQERDLWKELNTLNDHLRQDHTCRRQMLLRRLDCTVESFKWKGIKAKSEERNRQELKQGVVKSMNDQIHEIYDKSRKLIKEEPQIGMANLLAVRERNCDPLLNSVVGSKSVDCKIAYGNQTNKINTADLVNLKQIIIPQVPDRGGRTDEIRPPVKETFGQQRGGGFRQNRGGRGRHR